MATRDIMIGASRAVEDTPFLKDSVYRFGDRQIGYLMYNHFKSGLDEYDTEDKTYDLYLMRLFERFKSEGVNEFVLDLRYNGGGSVSCAQLLTSLLTKEEALGKPFCLLEYNDKHTDDNTSLPLLRTTEVLAGNLNLQRIFVLTGNTTASASELLINALRPYLGDSNVRLIGKQTLGKTVGMTVYDESEKYGWILSPVTFHVYNKNREANYGDGFSPDIPIDEFQYELADFGDLSEPLLAQAIQEITGWSGEWRSAPLSSSQEVRYEPLFRLGDNLLLLSGNPD